MKTCTIAIKSFEDAKVFVNIVGKFEYKIDLMSEHYVVDAKSIMGIFSLDLDKPLTVRSHSDDCDDLLKQLEPFKA